MTAVRTLRPFAENLADARAQIIYDPADAVVAVLMEQEGFAEDPRAGVGVQDDWYRSSWAVDAAIRVMVQGFGMTQHAAARRMGYSPTRAGNARRPPELSVSEQDLFGAALDRLGRRVR